MSSKSRGNGAGAPKRIVLLGATGSIGKSCARVILDNPGQFSVEAVVGGRAGAALARTAIELDAKFAAIAEPSGYADLKAGLAGHDIEFGCGAEAMEAAARWPADLVVSAIVGAVGLKLWGLQPGGAGARHDIVTIDSQPPTPTLVQPSERGKLVDELLAKVDRLDRELTDLRREGDLLDVRKDTDALWERYSPRKPATL